MAQHQFYPPSLSPPQEASYSLRHQDQVKMKNYNLIFVQVTLVGWELLVITILSQSMDLYFPTVCGSGWI